MTWSVVLEKFNQSKRVRILVMSQIGILNEAAKGKEFELSEKRGLPTGYL